MIELIQFLKWILRQVWAIPGRILQKLTETFECSDWPMTLVLFILTIFMSGVLAGSVIFGLLRIPSLGSIVCLLIWTVGYGFVAAAGIRVMYRAFRQEQQDFMDRLRGKY